MKKPLLIFIIILAVLSALPFISFVRWVFQEKKPMDIIIVDKTVPTLDRIKHKSFNWVLTSGRFVSKDKKSSYSYRKDYYGFAPTKPLKERGSVKNEYRLSDMIELPEKSDALYIADTYGVFFNDWYSGINKSRKSRKLYGGLNNNDYLLINEMKERNKLVILEYNSFDYPTAQFEAFRTQEKLGISFSGWTGKYFASLDTTTKDFPIWMTAMYRKQHRKPWTFTKPGVVLITEKDIIVLEEGSHLTTALPVILTGPEDSQKFGVPESVTFDKWFDIIDPLTNNVISSFDLNVTPQGDSLLADFGLSASFPAVVQEPVNGNTWYFSGDFATNKVMYWTSRIKGIEKLKGILYSSRPDDPRRFFWVYYKPLITSIFDNYYNSINK